MNWIEVKDRLAEMAQFCEHGNELSNCIVEKVNN
jgi:hypothetical protein